MKNRARSARLFVCGLYLKHMPPYADERDDPLLETELDQEVERAEDLEELKSILMRRYPTPTSAIEDYRSGYIPEFEMEIRFTPEEIDFIKRKKEERDRADDLAASQSVL